VEQLPVRSLGEPVKREWRPDRIPAELFQHCSVMLVDPHPHVEREAVEGDRVAGMLERIGEAHPTVHFGRLKLGDAVVVERTRHGFIG
jgi:hypothetical protein